MFFADIGPIEQYWRELLLNICQPIYKLIVYLYELFEVIGTAEILTSEILTTLYGRIGMILGIYMLFRIIFSFIQMLVNPDYISDKEKGVGKIVSKAILTILLLAVTPFLFNKAFEIQNFIVGAGKIENNIIAKLIFPKNIISSESFGPTLSAYLFESFYRYDDDYIASSVYVEDCIPLQLSPNGVTTNLHNSIIRSKGSVGYAKICLITHEGYTSTYSMNNKENYKISFTWNGVFAIIAGLVVCYTLLTYTLMVGARVIQLAFLRIISPMAILTFLSPKKDTMFEKWLKMCTTTYLDLFIRMAIIYFVVYIIDVIMVSENGIALINPYDNMWIVNVVMILALLIFAKKAPELLKELFPKSGTASLGFGLKSPKKLIDDMMFGSTINKGMSSVGKRIRKVPGNFARQSMGRIDVLRHGGTWEQAKEKYPGFIRRGWHKWQKENAPLAYKSYENRIAGNEEIATMNTNWNAGQSIKDKIENSYRYRAARAVDPNIAWTDIFDGETFENYRLVYNNSEFIRSKMAVDKLGDQEKLLSSISSSILSPGDLDLQLTGLKKPEQKLIHDALGDSVMHYDSTTDTYSYVSGSIDLRTFHEKVAKHAKKVKGAEANHESLRKVYARDAEVEDQIKFRKNNDTNPTNP